MRRSSTASRVREAGDNCHLNLTKSGSYKYTIQRLAIANTFLNQNQIHETALRDNTAWASIYIDQNLNFSTQTDNICNKAKRTLAALKRAAPLLSIETPALILNTMVLPHLDYCCTIWGTTSDRPVAGVGNQTRQGAVAD